MNPQPVSLAVLMVEFLDGKRLHFKVNACSDQVGFFHWGGGEIIQQAKRYGGVYARHGEALALNGEPSMTQLYPPEFYPLASIRKMKMLKMSADELSALLAQHAAEPSKGLLSEPVQAFIRSNKGVSLDLSSYQDGDDELPVAAHVAEQPKLTELRAVLKKWDSFHGYTAGQLVSDIRALLTSPVAPPPRPLVPLDGGNWYYDAQRDIVMIDGRKYEPAVEEFRIAPPVAPGEPPPQPICKHGVAGCPECKTGIFATPPAQERASEEWWKAEALDVIRHARTNEPHDDWQDWSNAISGGLLRAYNRGVATAAKQAREGALEEVIKILRSKQGNTRINEALIASIAALAAQPSPQTACGGVKSVSLDLEDYQ